MKEFTEFQLSALSEAGNIGAGHAAIALSQLLGRKIMIAVSKVKIGPPGMFEAEMGAEALLLGVSLKVLGDAQGVILFALKREQAFRMADVLLNRSPGTTKLLSDMDRSALKETGSILSASYLNALSDLMHLTLIPSVPTLFLDKTGFCFPVLFRGALSDQHEFLIGIENELVEASTRIKGYFLFMPDQKGLRVLLKALGVGG